jgi:large subunit ribosomal protein L23
MSLANIIIKPLLSEKATLQAESQNTYAFHVAPDADKTTIKKAVETLYNVKVTGVRTLTRKGKPKRSKVKVLHTSDYKRALVTLAPDNKIELF